MVVPWDLGDAGVVGAAGLEPACLAAGDFKSPAYAISPRSQGAHATYELYRTQAGACRTSGLHRHPGRDRRLGALQARHVGGHRRPGAGAVSHSSVSQAQHAPQGGPASPSTCLRCGAAFRLKSRRHAPCLTARRPLPGTVPRRTCQRIPLAHPRTRRRYRCSRRRRACHAGRRARDGTEWPARRGCPDTRRPR